MPLRSILRSFWLIAGWRVHTTRSISLFGLDHTPARLALANTALQAALRLHPNSGEARLALAQHLGCQAISTTIRRAKNCWLPDSSCLTNRLFSSCWVMLTGARVAGSNPRATWKKALPLDPRNAFLYQQLALTQASCVNTKRDGRCALIAPWPLSRMTSARRSSGRPSRWIGRQIQSASRESSKPWPQTQMPPGT